MSHNENGFIILFITMSRIGKNPITIPSWVEIKVDGRLIKVKGPKWELEYTHPRGVKLDIEDNQIKVTIESDEYRNYWGLVRTLVANMIEGVTNGFKKELLVIWVGYSAKMQWDTLVLWLGFSHPVEYKAPKGVTITVDKAPKAQALIRVEGIDKQKVWEIAAKIRAFKKPEPYKGKGIRYIDEQIKLKQGKTAGK